MGIQLCGLATGIIIARLVGPTGKGEIAAVILWPGLIAAVGDLGLYDAVVFFSARTPGREKVLCATSGLLALALSSVLIVAGYLLLPLALGHFGPEVLSVGRLYLLWIPLSLLDLSAMGLLQGRLQVSAFNRLRVCVVATTLAGLVALWLAHRVSLLDLALVYLAAHMITLLACIVALQSRGWLGFRPDLRLIRPMLSYGVKSNTGNISALANERADQAVISLFLAPAELGYYSVAVTLTSAIGLFGSSFALVTLPALAGADDVEQAHRELGRFVRATWALSAAAAIAVMLLTPTLLRVVFGPAFMPAAPVAEVLLVASIVLSTNKVTAAGLKALNMPLLPTISEVIAAAITVAALGGLLPRLGIMGAAVASLLAYATSFVYMGWAAKRKAGISPRVLLTPTRSDLAWLQAMARRPWARTAQPALP